MTDARGVLLIVLLALTGCGFHLRGTGTEGLSLDAIHIASVNAYGELQREVEQVFVRAGVATGPEADSPYTLRILSERTTRRPIATGGGSSAAQYELRLEMAFELTDGGDTVIEPTTLAVERVYRFDLNSFVGSSEEEDLLTEEMRRELANQLLRRVGASIRANESSS